MNAREIAKSLEWGSADEEGFELSYWGPFELSVSPESPGADHKGKWTVAITAYGKDCCGNDGGSIEKAFKEIDGDIDDAKTGAVELAIEACKDIVEAASRAAREALEAEPKTSGWFRVWEDGEEPTRASHVSGASGHEDAAMVCVRSRGAPRAWRLIVQETSADGACIGRPREVVLVPETAPSWRVVTSPDQAGNRPL